MLLLRTDKLHEGEGWPYEVKFDGYRALAIKSVRNRTPSDHAPALAIKTGGQVRLRSRNDKDFTKRYPGVVAALESARFVILLSSAAPAVAPERRSATSNRSK